MDLTTAGMISGGGNAGTAALANIQTAVLAGGLQDERAQWEAKRVQLQNDYTTQRDTTAYDRQRADVADARTYADTREEELYTKGRARKGTEAVEDLATRKGMINDKAAVDSAEFNAGAPLRKKQTEEALDVEKRKGEMETDNEIRKGIALAENKAWLKAQMTLANAKESSASRAQAAKTMWELEQGKEGAKLRDDYLTLKGDPNADPAAVLRAKEKWSTFSTKPGDAEKMDGANAAAGLKEAGNEIVRLQGMMKDQVPGTPEYDALARRLQNAEQSHEAYDLRLKELTGSAKPVAKPKMEIKDRFKDTTETPEPNTQAGSTVIGQALKTPPKRTGMINSQRRFERPVK